MTETESDAAVLERMGTDAAKWTDEFMRVKHEIEAAGDGRSPDDWGWMIAWFASAIEAGRTAGRRETCPHYTDRLTLADDLIMCGTCGATL